MITRQIRTTLAALLAAATFGSCVTVPSYDATDPRFPQQLPPTSGWLGLLGVIPGVPQLLAGEYGEAAFYLSGFAALSAYGAIELVSEWNVENTFYSESRRILGNTPPELLIPAIGIPTLVTMSVIDGIYTGARRNGQYDLAAQELQRIRQQQAALVNQQQAERRVSELEAELQAQRRQAEELNAIREAQERALEEARSLRRVAEAEQSAQQTVTRIRALDVYAQSVQQQQGLEDPEDVGRWESRQRIDPQTGMRTLTIAARPVEGRTFLPLTALVLRGGPGRVPAVYVNFDTYMGRETVMQVQVGDLPTFATFVVPSQDGTAQFFLDRDRTGMIRMMLDHDYFLVTGASTLHGQLEITFDVRGLRAMLARWERDYGWLSLTQDASLPTPQLNAILGVVQPGGSLFEDTR